MGPAGTLSSGHICKIKLCLEAFPVGDAGIVGEGQWMNGPDFWEKYWKGGPCKFVTWLGITTLASTHHLYQKHGGLPCEGQWPPGVCYNKVQQ